MAAEQAHGAGALTGTAVGAATILVVLPQAGDKGSARGAGTEGTTIDTDCTALDSQSLAAKVSVHELFASALEAAECEAPGCGTRRPRMCTRVLAVLLLAAAPGRTVGQEGAGAQRPVRVVAHRATEAPVIDGRLDDPAWRSATPCDAFLQREPTEGGRPSERTVLRVLVDGDYLYFGIRCYDPEPQRIMASRMRRDAQLWEDDHIQIILDPYNDRRGGFFFSTNPLGARRDALLSDEGRTRNEAWDCVWSCRARRDEAGWSAELAVPLDQLRYPDSEDAVWGINVGRMVRRKNEEVYLVPPPQAFGFDGPYRTSYMAELTGLGHLESRTCLEITPYLLPGNERDFDGLDTSEQLFFDAGLDLKYGLTPSLTLDLSYNTDFAQVEADQEQVNLTRFSLFFPEKRDFFLEGAGIFDVGERFERFGGAPPTLLFYSRRIGIEEGHAVPVLFGSKLTGRLGSYQIGALSMVTEPELFRDEVDEDQYLTEGGDWLDDDDIDDLEDRGEVIPTFVDTVAVEVIDTLDVDRALFSVFRLQRDVLGRSSVGIMAIDRTPGEDEADYNRALGVDASLSFHDAATQVRGFAARTWSPDLSGDEYAGFVEIGHQGPLVETRLSYLDVGENFNPEVGFAPRDDIRRLRGSVWVRPRPAVEWIRRLAIGPGISVIADHEGEVLTRQLELPIWVNLEMGDWLGFAVRQRYEMLDESFEVHDDIEIPEGEYTFRQVYVRAFPNRSRRLSGGQMLEYGEFFDGTRLRWSSGAVWKVNGNLTVEVDYELNRVDLPTGDFLTNRLSNRVTYSYSPELFVRGFAQWNSKREVVGGNFLLSYQYRPGSDLYLVYNHAWDTEGGWRQLNRSLQMKLAYFWQP